MNSTTSQDIAATHEVAATRPHTGRLAGLGWAHFLNDGAANYLPGILPAILVSLHVNVALAGTIMAALLMGQALQPLAGYLADHIGGKAFIVVGLAGSSLGGALIGFAPGYWSLLAMLAIIGISNSLFHPQALAAVRANAGTRVGLSMSIFLIGGEIGRGLWPEVSSWVVTLKGIPYLWILAIPAVITLPFLARWAPTVPPRHPDTKPIRWRAHAGPLAVLIAFSSLRSMMIASAVTFIPLLWYERGGSLTTGAAFITVMLVVGVIGNAGGGHIADSLGRRRIVIAAITAATILLAAFLFVGTGPWLWPIVALLGIALFATLPLTILMGQDILPENRSMGSGIALGFSNAMGALGVMILGPVAAAWGSTTALWVTVLAGVLSIPLAFVLPRHDEA